MCSVDSARGLSLWLGMTDLLQLEEVPTWV